MASSPSFVHAHIQCRKHSISSYEFLISCSLSDNLRKFTMASYFTHMSLCISLLCAFVGFLAGIELALEHEVSSVNQLKKKSLVSSGMALTVYDKHYQCIDSMTFGSYNGLICKQR